VHGSTADLLIPTQPHGDCGKVLRTAAGSQGWRKKTALKVTQKILQRRKRERNKDEDRTGRGREGES
jgi:hypothetical protein